MKVTSEQLLDLFGLKVGDRILYNGFDYTVIENKQDRMMLKLTNGYSLSSIMNLLNEDYEIIKQTPKLTEDEKVILRNLPIEYKGYIARYCDTHCDGFSILIACKTKPIKDNDLGVWASNDDFTNLPYDHLFQFITWEDEEPYNIKELLDER